MLSPLLGHKVVLSSNHTFHVIAFIDLVCTKYNFEEDMLLKQSYKTLSDRIHSIQTAFEIVAEISILDFKRESIDV